MQIYPSDKIKDWVGNKRSTYSTLGASNHSNYERAENDFYATDPLAIDALLQKESLNKPIWECACGSGNLSERLLQLGHSVISTDLIDRGYGESGIDFLRTDKLFAPIILTNPPYKYAKEFVEHALNLGAERVYMFLKLTFLESVGRKELFDKLQLKNVYVFRNRIQAALNNDPAMMEKSSAACYAWFCWDKDYNGLPQIDWIYRPIDKGD